MKKCIALFLVILLIGSFGILLSGCTDHDSSKDASGEEGWIPEPGTVSENNGDDNEPTEPAPEAVYWPAKGADFDGIISELRLEEKQVEGTSQKVWSIQSPYQVNTENL